MCLLPGTPLSNKLTDEKKLNHVKTTGKQTGHTVSYRIHTLYVGLGVSVSEITHEPSDMRAGDKGTNQQ